MYQRVGEAAYKVDLSNTIALCAYLGNPQKQFPSVHIAGTNGKGSTSHIVASVLQESGLKVGLYTSPHLLDFRERIKINGENIAKAAVVDFTIKNKPFFEQTSLSFFEMTVGMAFAYFAKEKVDIAVIETGLGGRLDSTNILTPEVTAITNIGLDHTQFLGTTLAKIAAEKGGVIKKNTPIIIGEKQAETSAVFEAIALKNTAPLIYADEKYKNQKFTTDLKGNYQYKNTKTAVAIISELTQKGWVISEKNRIDGLNNVVKNTHLLGRWQILHQNPLTICDTGHNTEGITEIVQQVKELKYNKLHFVLGVVNDKNCATVLDLLPKKATYYFTKASIPRAMPAEDLHKKAITYHLKGSPFSTVKEAINSAQKNATKEDLIFIGGSTFVVADALKLLGVQ